MHRPRTASLALLLTTVLLIVPTLTSFAHEASPAQTSIVYLPAIQTPAYATITFASDIDDATDEPINPGNSFGYGIDYIYVFYSIHGLQGHQYRLDFTYSDGETLDGDTYTVSSNNLEDWTAYCITRSGTCSFGRVTLPAGPYTARLYIDNNLYLEAQASIN